MNRTAPRRLRPTFAVQLAWPACLALAFALGLAPSALAAEEAAAVEVRGEGFAVEKFDEGGRAFANRQYLFGDVPEAFRGWQYTRIDGGGTTSMRVTVARDTTLHMVTSQRQQGIDLTGWTAIDSGTLHYTAKGNTPLTIYTRPLAAGQSIDIPQGNWAGGMLLAPKIKAIVPPRRLDLSKVPGVVIDHLPADSGLYVGSPSIAILPGGDYVASHDIFGPKSTKDEAGVTRIFGSSDRGQTWKPLTELRGAFWSTLFVHRGALYLIGTSKRFGDMIVRRSDDGGRTWTEAKDADSGIILQGEYHCAPQPVVVHNGRIWRAQEAIERPFRWGRSFKALMVSAPEDADLLKASNWTASNALPGDTAWDDGKFNGWLEGNAVVTPEGRIVDILRVDLPRGGRAAVVNVSADGRTATFDPKQGMIDFPGGAKKFTIRFDPVSKRYWSLANYIPPRHEGPTAGGVRNTLALTSSADLRHWRIDTILLYHPDQPKHGFQYPDWVFDGDDLAAVSRTAYDDGLGGAHNMHDANLLTFHRVKNFRTLSMKDSCVRPEEIGLKPQSK